MFDSGIVHLIDGPQIDSPMNVLTFTLDYHRLFGKFEIYLEPTGIQYQCRIDSTEQSPFYVAPYPLSHVR